jgi:hypothetical protein
MTTVDLNSDLAVKRWSREAYREYVRQSGFKTFMGKSQNDIIHMRSQLKNEAGDTINIPLLAKIKGEPKRGSQPIEGNEKGMANFNFRVGIDWVGEGVAVSNSDTFRTVLDLLKEGRSGLVNFMAEITRNDLIDALNSKNGIRDVTGISGYLPADAAIRNAWTAANSDRILFGDTAANYNSTFATALANVGTKLSKATVQNARMMARTARRIIRPSTVEERSGMSGKGGNIVECYVMFVGAKTFLNLKQDPEIRDDLRYAMDRGANNPLFQPDDLLIDNVIIREIPEITERCIMGGVGASNADIEPYYLCGAQAIAYAIGKEATFKTDARDYGHINGVAVRELRGIEKTIFTGPLDDSTSQIDHGMLTGYVVA